MSYRVDANKVVEIDQNGETWIRHLPVFDAVRSGSSASPLVGASPYRCTAYAGIMVIITIIS